jgi:uncharacterized protein with LGFP repeats
MTMCNITVMRGLIASSIGVACAAALALPPAVPVSAAEPSAVGAPGPGSVGAGSGNAGSRSAGSGDVGDVPGRTQSLPLPPAASGRGRVGGGARTAALYRSDVRRFSLVGVVWDDPDTELEGRVQVRTRATGTGEWTGWRDVETHNEDHGADPDAPEGAPERTHGSTAPLWTGDSDGVDVRVVPDAAQDPDAAAAPLPAGLRLDLVDPGEDDAPPRTPVRGSITARDPVTAAASAVLPALTRQQTEQEAKTLHLGDLGDLVQPDAGKPADAPAAKPYIGPRPRIITRRGWGANEKLREKGFVYTKRIKAAFVHHTASGNTYRCSQAPSVIRSIYRYHVVSSGWRDIGYNFLVDRCGNIYEGRAGGVTKPVMGAHTRGFNTDSMGIAVIGTFSRSAPPAAAVKAVAELTAWKLGLYGADPRASTYLKSAGGNLYRKGKNVRLNVISGHRDGFRTDCPGRLLYGKLGAARSSAARYQGR